MNRVTLSMLLMFGALLLSLGSSDPLVDLIALGLGVLAFVGLIIALVRNLRESPDSLDWT